jgi:hypothetical protein
MSLPSPDSPLRELDFVYLPSRDVAADVERYTAELGAELVFAIEAFGTRVARLALGSDPPAILLAEHLEGDAPILVFRVDDLEVALEALTEAGHEPAERFGFPYGPGCMLTTPAPQRVAVYERTRGERGDGLAGRRDF